MICFFFSFAHVASLRTHQGMLTLVSNCIDRLNVYNSAAHFGECAGSEAGAAWKDILNLLYELLGKETGVTHTHTNWGHVHKVLPVQRGPDGRPHAVYCFACFSKAQCHQRTFVHTEHVFHQTQTNLPEMIWHRGTDIFCPPHTTLSPCPKACCFLRYLIKTMIDSNIPLAGRNLKRFARRKLRDDIISCSSRFGRGCRRGSYVRF